jgi:hypothetical protein
MCFEEATKIPSKTQVVSSGGGGTTSGSPSSFSSNQEGAGATAATRSSSPVTKSTKGSVYEKTDIGAYQKKVEDTVKKYSALSVQQKTAAVAPEFVGVKGAISVPVAAAYDDSKTSLNEIAANASDLASAAKTQNIELCGFLSDLPSIDFDMSLPGAGIPALQDIMKEINGISMPSLEFGASAITDAIGGATKAIGDLASAIQSNIPTVNCGGISPLLPVTPAGFAAALIPGGPLVTTLAPIALKQVGITPPINISSPDVTVQALNDVLEAGEF